MASASPASAQARFERLAHIVAAASREGGVEIETLARDFSVPTQRILDDIRELTTRGDYRPGGWPGDILVFVEGDRIRVEHTSFMDRPLRLTFQEHLCLALALRGEPVATRPDSHARLDQSGGELLGASDALTMAGVVPPDRGALPGIAVSDRIPDHAQVHKVVTFAARSRRPCRIRYLKLAAKDESRRVVHPYLVAFSDETWYVVARCMESDAVKIFRMDRILSAVLGEGAFDIPSDFDAKTYLDGGADEFFFASVGRNAYVRYSPRIVKWIRERASYRSLSMEDNDDGSVTVCHSVADPQWLVCHVLRYAGNAVVEGPEEFRRMVAEVARKIADLAGERGRA